MVYHVVPPSIVVVNHFLILSRKPIGTALGSSCSKSGTGKTYLLLMLMISDQCTYTCLHHNTPFYAFISYILIFVEHVGNTRGYITQLFYRLCSAFNVCYSFTSDLRTIGAPSVQKGIQFPFLIWAVSGT